MPTTPLRIALASLLLSGCGSVPADRYQAPPKDGSVAANSADVVDNPAIVPMGMSGAGERRGEQHAAGTPTAKLTAIDPISNEPVSTDAHVGYYGQWQVRFSSAANAVRFASLPKAQRDVLAAPQVLAQQGIRNNVCPLTGATLTASAAGVMVDGSMVGFATMADANRYRALDRAKQDAIIAAWKKDGSK
jgi:hypothetical protein